MKVYSCPPEVAWADPDYANYDPDKERKREAEHEKALREWLVTHGYPGKNTGGILRMPWADGAACYMLAEGRTSCLIHLPYGDAWNAPDARFLPKSEVLKRIGRDKKIAAIFAAKDKEITK